MLLAVAFYRDLGSYPGLKEGTSVVTGELHDVDSDVLRRVDNVEGLDLRHLDEALSRASGA